MDSDPDRARQAGESLDVPWTISFDEVLADRALDGVVLATPTAQHADMIESAARAGKHVLVEKPVAFDTGSAVRAITAAKGAGIALQVGFHRRFDLDWRAAHERVAAGAIGEPRLLRIAHRNASIAPVVPLESLGDILVDVAIHDFDTARWLIGEVAEITAIASGPRAAAAHLAAGSESVVVTMRFESGALGIVDNTRTAGYGFECSGEILGSSGGLRVGAARGLLDLEWLTNGEGRVSLAPDHEKRHEVAYVAELEHFAQVLLGAQGPEPTGEDGAAALAIAQAARVALAEGGAVRLQAAQGVSATTSPRPARMSA
jgi:myo-inositol 2-dehydrogenase/D-chiro-inositol 1-dehydrogenase